MTQILLRCLMPVAVILGGCLSAFTTRPLPMIEGQVTVPGLEDEVHVVRDRNGVPHIFARCEEDSYVALGYVHAQDRLWQMHMMRHLAEGRLAELVGARDLASPLFDAKNTLELDHYHRVLGFKYLAEMGMERLDAGSGKILSLYAAGVNAYVEQHANRLPAEFRLLGLEFEPWQPRDTAAIYLYIAWSLNNDWQAEALRYAIAAERGAAKAWEMVPHHLDPGPFILEEFEGLRAAGGGSPDGPCRGEMAWDRRLPQSAALPAPGNTGGPCLEAGSRMTGTDRCPAACPSPASNGEGAVGAADPAGAAGVSAGIAELLHLEGTVGDLRLRLGFPAASNNWVVAGHRTVSGKPLLCNDPHMPLPVPSIWYPIHINRPGMDVMGVMFPGTPAIAIGRNRRIAWGNTTPFEDTMDLFLERANPDNPEEYLYRGSWQRFYVRNEMVCCRHGKQMKCHTLPVRMTVHGPIVNDVVPSLRGSPELLALRWSAYDLDFRSRGLRMLRLGEAGNWDEFRRSIDIGIPIFNWVYADVDGNIGYATPGLIPRRPRGDGTWPAPGWTGEYDWQGYLPFDQVPSVYNPPRGFVVTANNQVFPEGAYPYTFSRRYMPSYRAWRIRELLLGKEKLAPEDMMRIQADVYTKQGERLAPIFIRACGIAAEQDHDPALAEALGALRRWDFRCGVESVGATVFHLAYQFAFENTLKDEMSEGIYRAFENDLTVDTAFDNLLERPDAALFDDRRTEQIETRDQVLVKSVKDAVGLLRQEFGREVEGWRWGGIHLLEMEHMAFGQVSVLRRLFNVGPFPMPGGRHTINNAYFALGDRERLWTLAGSSFREVHDLSRADSMLAIISLGQSGQRWSPHYRDQTEKWLKGEYLELSLDPETIRRESEGELVLTPPKPQALRRGPKPSEARFSTPTRTPAGVDASLAVRACGPFRTARIQCLSAPGISGMPW